MLFELIDGFLDTVCDVIQYGPLGALDIATSDCPGAERMCREITGQSTAKWLEPISTSSSIAEAKKSLSTTIDVEQKNNTVDIEESEEEIISKAIAEKGHW